MINVLSLFDGLSGARIALEQLGIDCTYYASEVDKYAIKVAMANYPDTIQLGDVTKVRADDLPKIDLLIGGSPCQDLSVAKSGREGLKGSRSGLFWEYVRLLRELKPKYFLLENVYSMKASDRDIISQEIGCSPMMINSALVTAQNRKRYYWHNTGVFMQPMDQGIVLADIIEDEVVDREKAYACKASDGKGTPLNQYLKGKFTRQMVFSPNVCGVRQVGRHIVNGKRKDVRGAKTKQRFETRTDGKSNCLSTVQKDSMVGIYTVPRGFNGGGMRKTNKAPTVSSSAFEHNNFLYTHEGIRKLTPLECERLQGIPENYTNHVSATQRYKMIGNGFTIPVIMHILKGMI